MTRQSAVDEAMSSRRKENVTGNKLVCRSIRGCLKLEEAKIVVPTGRNHQTQLDTAMPDHCIIHFSGRRLERIVIDHQQSHGQLKVL